jgi:hypothetical protein
MRIAAIAIAIISAGCGQPATDPQSAQSFENARSSAGHLLTGSAADWASASADAKLVYAISSADALVQNGVTLERQTSARAFMLCMDAEVARSQPTALLGDVSYICASAFMERAR